MSYKHLEIEKKWQDAWDKANCFKATMDTSKPKFYALDMFPYPSASGLHVGHPEGYTATDIVSRYKRCKGFNVLHPMGWDAFGLPAEQYAIKTGVHPAKTTEDAIVTFKRQLKSLGFSYDWSREISTCDPKYYKWTQFIFTKLLEKGLAYQKEAPVNWCPALRTVLANDEVVDGKSERGGHPIERVPMKQWMLKITSYADRLLDDLDKVDWPERTKEAQKNWIGKSIGAEIDFSVKGAKVDAIRVFTTRPDTLFGATFMVLAPEHPLVSSIATTEQSKDVKAYQLSSSKKSDIDRQASTEKTGVFTGAFAIHPITKKEIPIWISDYVLMGYGTGAIMCVPAHDERDYDFEQKFDLTITQVVDGGDLPYSGEGKMVNSDFLNGLNKEDAIKKMLTYLEDKKLGEKSIQYKFRDWLFSRQRYWGEPFPLVRYPNGDLKALPVDELPVLLPNVADYQPSEKGESPLARSKDFVNTKDKDGNPVTRETDTMPGSAASSWYFLRYCDPHNDNEAFSFEAQNYWMPVDLYLGGPEHTVGHLLYSRFWQKVLFDAGLVTHEEPFHKLVHQGMILGGDGEKMSKSRGNVINPDEVVNDLGADSLRLYEMFMGPLDKDKPWSTQGIQGVRRFLDRLWRLCVDPESDKLLLTKDAPTEDLNRLLHKTIKKVTEDIENLSFNTAISQMMILVNEIYKTDARPQAVIKPLVQLLAPFAPHIAEELWEKMGEKAFVSLETWPVFDPKLCVDDEVTIGVQINGKRKGEIKIGVKATQEEAMKAVMSNSTLAAAIDGKTTTKIVYVPSRILNIMIK
ncbi:MAG: leucine--tRNA ligase [Bdellovibrionales bacterium]|nr:leucine--tRNA ligase [Bdellovibrionales bacterium]